ncbi:MAG: hypothetical protein RLZZ618_900 [Pseudomonadota bacterium]|jgi:hypothetical protein
MGAWGPALYSDDTTCDVRDDYVKQLKQGASDEDAWRHILAGYRDVLGVTEIACLVYFALADTAWRYGRLNEEVRAKALSLLEAGGDTAVWEQDSPGKDARARQRALTKLEAQLRSPQPRAKPVKITPPKPKTVHSTEPVGSVFLLPLPRGKHALMVLIGYHDMEESIDPVFSVLRWRGDAPQPDLNGLVGTTGLLSFKSGLGPKTQLGILPGDKPVPLLARLVPLNAVVAASLPFDPYKAMWISIGRIAKEAEAELDAQRC